MIVVAAQSAYDASLLREPAERTQAFNNILPELRKALKDSNVPAEGSSKLL